MSILTVIITLFILSTLGVLVCGVISMAVGGEFNRKYSNKLMIARVSLQFASIILLAVLFMVS